MTCLASRTSSGRGRGGVASCRTNPRDVAAASKECIPHGRVVRPPHRRQYCLARDRRPRSWMSRDHRGLSVGCNDDDGRTIMRAIGSRRNKGQLSTNLSQAERAICRRGNGGSCHRASVVVDQDRREKAARAAIDRFIAAYETIDWRTHGRLVYFRNLGIAHLTLQELERFITYAELERLVRTAVAMGGALVFFVDNAFPVSERDLEEYATRAAEVWRAIIDETSDPADDL